MPAPLLIVDAPSLLYRAFFALPKSITDAEGKAVNALLGTTNLLLREVEEHKPRAVVLCFGPDAARYRVELYEPYHADRPPVPGDLGPQFADAPQFFGAFAWSSVIDEELEADDVMGSLAKVEEKAGGRALLMTGDRDLFQCVTAKVHVLYVRTGVRGGELVDAAEVKRRYGIPPELVPDFIALRGDPSDGIPGAKGVGEKTAAELLRRRGSLESAIENAVRERPPRLSGALLEGADDLRMFKDLATLRTVKVRRPTDKATDYAGGAKAARRRGMNRLAERLVKATDGRR
ncbi:MAG TPA: 5'-3' exonuclease [Solirubrobacterales bacterium]|jgi:DNA polymerase-1|nr:5'-3' exonuclease [Solirubrobacterales bacterium]